MNICVCFSGQLRTFEDTIMNIKRSVFDTANHYTIVYCTWLNTDVKLFTDYFPDAHIHLIEQPQIDSQLYLNWLDSFGRGYKPENFYGFFCQAYCIHMVAEYASKLGDFDLGIRIRPDILFRYSVYNHYEMVRPNMIVVSEQPSYAGTNDFFWIARFEECMTLMKGLLYSLNDDKLVPFLNAEPELILKLYIKKLGYDEVVIPNMELDILKTW
jgi:hypothetical protein